MKTAWTAMAVLLILPATALAEEPARDTESILARIRDARPSEVAWGAYLAGAEGTKDAVPFLLTHLRPDPKRSSKEWLLAHRAVLDALIRLDAKVPSEALVPRLGSDLRTMALILLAREPVKNRGILLDRFVRGLKDPKRIDLETIAVGNLLAKGRAPGFAVRVIRRTPATLTIHVREPGEACVGIGGSFSIGCGDGLRRVPEGFPPFVTYEFREAGSRAGDEVFSSGPVPVAYRRTERKGTRIGIGSTSIRHERFEVMNGWVAAMLETKPERVRIRAHQAATIHFESTEAYLVEATRARDRILKTYWAAARLLLDRKLLTLAEAKSLAFSVKVVIADEREDKSVALPPLPATTVRPDWPNE